MKSLDQLTADDLPLAGGKAWNCARLKQSGFPVPDAIVVPATASEAELRGVRDHPWFDAQPPEALFAVRSSGADEDALGHSFAGIHETHLGVRRADLADAVAACRRSANSPEAHAYRRAMGLTCDGIQTAVLIQRMIPASSSGVAFTINPVTGADELVINSSWGVGDRLVAGRITPDEFRVRKQDRALLTVRAGRTEDEPGVPGHAEDGQANASSLETPAVQELAALLASIERYYGAPQDVEWCHDGTQFWIVQSRPVTAKNIAARDPARVPTGARESEWTRANLAEVLPDLTSPQALTCFEEMLNEAQRRFLRGLLAPEHVLGPMFKSFYGRLYFNLSQIRHVCALGGTPPASMLKSLGHPGDIAPEDEKAGHLPFRRRLEAVPALLRLIRRHLGAARLLRDHNASVAAFHARLAAIDPATLSDRQIWAVIDEWRRGAPDTMQIVLIFAGVLFYEEQLRKICQKAGVAFEGFLLPQLAAGERSVSARQAFDLVELARIARQEPGIADQVLRDPLDLPALRIALRGTDFLSGLDRFLDTYGHRGRYESDWALPRYSEDPTPLLRAIRGHLEGAADVKAWDPSARQAQEAAAAWSAFEQHLTMWQRWTLLPQARWLTKRIKQYYVWREQTRFEMVRTLSVLRRWHLVLAHRFVERGWIETRQEYFLLYLDEVAQAVLQGPAAVNLREIIARRAAEFARYRRISMPLLMREAELRALIRVAGISAADASGDLLGVTTSAGCVEGEVAVIHDPGDFASMKRGAILVARATDPSWTPLFTLASGVIVEVGGMLSHASTVAREYGLPALANVKHATTRLRSGERVVLNATEGFVRRVTVRPR